MFQLQKGSHDYIYFIVQLAPPLKKILIVVRPRLVSYYSYFFVGQRIYLYMCSSVEVLIGTHLN